MKFAALSLVSLLVGGVSAFTAPSAERVGTALFARKPFITGNWKLNPSTKDEAIDLAKGIASAVTSNNDRDVALFVPFPYIEPVMEAADGKITIGAESSTPELGGAFTGGISPPMLESIGVKWVLAGHSERRTIFKEDNEYINAQCVKVLDQGMNVMLCIGETLEEFEKNLVGDVCKIQLKKALAGVAPEDMSRVAIAYEPVWAIGTGKVATPEIAQSVHSVCRNILVDMYGKSIADDTRILYGGSVTAESVDALMSQPDIDGTLVGGASLNAEGFGRIINFQSETQDVEEVDEDTQADEETEPDMLSKLKDSVMKIFAGV